MQKKLHFNFKNSFNYNKHLLKFGDFGFKIKFTTCVLKNQESFFKLLLLKNLKRINLNKKSKVFFFSLSYFTKTKLPLESRMGKGKGEIVDLFGYYKKGFILFELSEISCVNIIKLKNQLKKQKIFSLHLI